MCSRSFLTKDLASQLPHKIDKFCECLILVEAENGRISSVIVSLPIPALSCRTDINEDLLYPNHPRHVHNGILPMQPLSVRLPSVVCARLFHPHV
jgi:hypothetical protein